MPSCYWDNNEYGKSWSTMDQPKEKKAHIMQRPEGYLEAVFYFSTYHVSYNFYDDNVLCI